MYWWEGESRRKAATTEDGMLEAPLLANGCKWVTVAGGDELGLLRKRINVVADEFHLEIDGAPMMIEVVDSAGALVDGATISFRSVNCEARQDRDYVTEEGVAEIPFVPCGPFRVEATIGELMTETAGVHEAGDGEITRLTLRLPFRQ